MWNQHHSHAIVGVSAARTQRLNQGFMPEHFVGEADKLLLLQRHRSSVLFLEGTLLLEAFDAGRAGVLMHELASLVKSDGGRMRGVVTIDVGYSRIFGGEAKWL